MQIFIILQLDTSFSTSFLSAYEFYLVVRKFKNLAGKLIGFAVFFYAKKSTMAKGLATKILICRLVKGSLLLREGAFN